MMESNPSTGPTSQNILDSESSKGPNGKSTASVSSPSESRLKSSFPPPPTSLTLWRRYLFFARTTLAVLCVGGTVGVSAVAYLSYSLGKKLDGLYSKSKPHQLEKQKHLYVNKADVSPVEGPSILDDEEEEDNASEVSLEQMLGLNDPENPLARFGENVMRKFRETKDDLSRKMDNFYHLTGSTSKTNFLMRDNPDTLMKIIKSHNQTAWKFGIESLANMKHEKWRNDDFWRVAQSMDPKSIIGLSQYLDVDLRFFLPLKKFPDGDRKCDVYENLYALLAQLPLEDTDAATKYFTEQALKSWRKKVEKSDGEENDTCYDAEFFLGGDHVEYKEFVDHVTSEHTKKEQLSCLQALICHSKLENNHDAFLKIPILPYLLEVVTSADCVNTRYLVAQIIGNVACRPEAIPTLVLSGWIGVLVKWRQTEESAFRLQLAAARALINIHGSYFLAHQEWNSPDIDVDLADIKESRSLPNHVPCLKEGVYAYEPMQSFFTGDFEADIVFVHGLLGGAAYTWRQSVDCCDKEVEKELSGEKPKGTCASSFSHCWPKDWLAKDVPKVRMFGVEYSTQLSDWEPVHPYETPEERTITARARELLTKLEAADVGTKRPIVWVTHSMGGLLVKEILRLAEKRQEDDSILANSCGVIFYGTPHKGSPLANFGNNFFYVFFPTIEVQELSYDNREYLDGLNAHFANLVDKGMQCLSFAELKPTVLGDFVSDSISIHLVPPDSANPNCGQFIPVDSDHMNVCKPSGTTDCFLYTMTVDFVRDCLEKQKIRSALKVASSAVNADADDGVTEDERYDLGHDMWP